jgi:hypothetical protein
VPATKTQGLFFGKEDVTDYTVKIDVGNYKKQAVTIRIVDQLPKTNMEKIAVAMGTATPAASAAPDGEGLLSWTLTIPAGAVKTITFSYRITRPKDWKLSQ